MIKGLGFTQAFKNREVKIEGESDFNEQNCYLIKSLYPGAIWHFKAKDDFGYLSLYNIREFKKRRDETPD